MFIIAGLGNPGKEYEKNRHNVGFMIIDNIVSTHGLSSDKKKFHAIINEGQIGEKKVITVKPTTFMNKSGTSVQEISRFYKVPLSNIIVIHDELDIITARVKIKTGGGNGGHNGLKDIDARIGKDYKRIRFGIDHPGDRNRVSSYVLSNFAKIEVDEVRNKINLISNNIELFLDDKNNNFLQNISQ